MLFLMSGEVNNEKYRNLLTEEVERARSFEQQTGQPQQSPIDRYLTLFFRGKLKIERIYEVILTEPDKLTDQNVYDMCMVTLTIADELPQPKVWQEIIPYFFALQVNRCYALRETDVCINTINNAVIMGNKCEWNFRELSGYDSFENYDVEYKTIACNFNFLLNEIYLEIPITKVKKGWFKKKDTGFMISPTNNSAGYFIINNHYTLLKHKIPKSFYMELFYDAIQYHNSAVFPLDTDLSMYINRDAHQPVQQMLYCADYWSVANVSLDGLECWIDNDDLLCVRAREPLSIRPEGCNAFWQEVRPHLYRLIYNQKFYISYLYGNEVYLWCN